MPTDPPPLVLHRYWITDERTGKRRLTKWHMSEADALERYPGAEADLQTREERSPSQGAGVVVRNGSR